MTRKTTKTTPTNGDATPDVAIATPNVAATVAAATAAIVDLIKDFRRVPASSILPNPLNPNEHSEEQRRALRAALKEIGIAKPLLVWENAEDKLMLVDGHMRLDELGDMIVPVCVLDVDQAGADKVLATLDPIGAMRTVNWEKAAALYSQINVVEGELSLMLDRFSQEAKDAIGAKWNEGLTDPDDVPAPPDEAITQPGDLWVLGDHRLLCGNSSSVDDVDRLLGGAVIHLVNTDPPYNVKVEPRSNNAIAAGVSSFSRREDLQCGRSTTERGKEDRARMGRKRDAITVADAAGMHHQGFDLARDKTKAKGTTKKMRAKDRPLTNDFMTAEAFEVMLDAWFGNMARVLLPGRSFYVWGGYANLGNYPPFLKKNDLYFSQGVVWDKQHPVLTRKDFMGAFEICFYGWRLGAGHEFFGPTNATDLWHIKKVNPQSMVHLTEKPVELASRAMQYSSHQGENVLDLFGGSGSTLIGAEQTGRKAFLMELDPPYCDVILERFAQFTGKQPVLERTGETFEQTRANRAGLVATRA